MKRNTGCGVNSHKDCPPMMACDVAKTHDHFCGPATVTTQGHTEELVIIGDVTIPALVEADICLPSAAFDTKNIRKNVFITECKAVPVVTPGQTTTTTADLFIEGYVHKNIQYAEGCDGYVRDHSVNVPFKCYQRLTNLGTIQVLGFSQKNSDVEYREIAKDGSGSNRCSFGSRHFENFNQPIECRLLRHTITETDIPNNFDRWGNFRKLTEKIAIDFVVRLTQLQGPTPPTPA